MGANYIYIYIYITPMGGWQSCGMSPNSPEGVGPIRVQTIMINLGQCTVCTMSGEDQDQVGLLQAPLLGHRDVLETEKFGL